MDKQPESKKVKHLIGIFEQKDVNCKRNKRHCKVVAASGRIKEKLQCDPCKFCNIEEEADGFCKICLEYLCARCVKEHIKAKMTREHSIMRKDIPKDAESLRKLKKMLFCSEHPERTISYDCMDHNAHVCHICKEDTHKECETTCLICQGQSSTGGLKDIFERLHTVREKVQSLKDIKEKRVEELLFEKNKIQEEQQRFFQQVKEKIAENVKTEKSNTEQLVSALVRDIMEEVEECEEIECDELCQIEVLEAAMQNCSDDNLALTNQVIERKVETLERTIYRLEQKGSAQIRFRQNAALLDDIPVGTLTVIKDESDTNLREQVEVTSDEVHEINVVQVSSAAAADNMWHFPEAEYSVPASYNVGLCDDYAKCSVYGIVGFPDGRLVMLDHENSKLKLFTYDLTFIDAERIDGNPIRICYLGRDLVAIQCSTRIYIYIIGGQSIYYYVSFAMGKLFCRGIAFYRDNIIAAIMSDVDSDYTINADDKVEIHLLDLEEKSSKKIISYFESVGGRELRFRDPIDISYAGNGVMLIAEPNVIHCFDLVTDRKSKPFADQRWYYRLDDDDVCHITNDGKSAFVCERGGCVRQIALESYQYDRVIISNIQSPNCMSIDKRQGRIIIGYKHNDSVEVFNFRYYGPFNWIEIEES